MNEQLRDSRGRFLTGPTDSTPRDSKGRYIKGPPDPFAGMAQRILSAPVMNGQKLVGLPAPDPDEYVMTFAVVVKLEFPDNFRDEDAFMADLERKLAPQFDVENWLKGLDRTPMALERKLYIALWVAIMWLMLAALFAVVQTY